MEAVPSWQLCQGAGPGVRRRVPCGAMQTRRPTRRGGGTACCTRSTRARSRTPTATGSATCAASRRASTTSSGSAIDGIWLNPTMPSPNDDWGYDVADYCGVHPDLGTLEDLDALVAGGARARDPRAARPRPQPHERPAPVVRRRACRAATRAHRDYYVWADPAPDGGPPNNWDRNFGGSAWQLARADRPVLPATTSCRASPTSTGGTTRCATRSTTCCGSGSRAGSRASGSTSATRSSRTASCATTRP